MININSPKYEMQKLTDEDKLLSVLSKILKRVSFDVLNEIIPFIVSIGVRRIIQTEPLNDDDMKNIIKLNPKKLVITGLTRNPLPYEYISNMKNLVYLDLSFTSIDSLYSLLPLTHLKFLYLSFTQIYSLSPIAHLCLKILDLTCTPIDNIEPLSNMTTLSKLYLSRTHIRDFSQLKLLKLRDIFLYEMGEELKNSWNKDILENWKNKRVNIHI